MGSQDREDSQWVVAGGPREVADYGMNGASSATASRPCGPTFTHT